MTARLLVIGALGACACSASMTSADDPEPGLAAPAPQDPAPSTPAATPSPSPSPDAAATPAPAPSPTPDAARDRATPAPDAAAAGFETGPAAPCRFQLCEGFERYADGAGPDPALWTRSSTTAIRVDSTRAVRGTKSLRISSPKSGSYFLREGKTFPAKGNAFYGRVFFYIDSWPTTDLHWTLLMATAPNGSKVRYGGMSLKQTHTFMFNLIPSERPAFPETGLNDYSTSIPLKTWHCVEWYFDAPKNEARMWWNGQERPKLHWQDNRAGVPQYSFPTWSQLNIGWEYYQMAGAYDVWIDEIAVDPQRIGCDP
jgi:hypothetical protein